LASTVHRFFWNFALFTSREAFLLTSCIACCSISLRLCSSYGTGQSSALNRRVQLQPPPIITTCLRRPLVQPSPQLEGIYQPTCPRPSSNRQAPQRLQGCRVGGLAEVLWNSPPRSTSRR
jgi:hypothetical protein